MSYLFGAAFGGLVIVAWVLEQRSFNKRGKAVAASWLLMNGMKVRDASDISVSTMSWPTVAKVRAIDCEGRNVTIVLRIGGFFRGGFRSYDSIRVVSKCFDE